MKNFDDTFKDISETVSMTDAEKNSMREYILEYQAIKPLPTPRAVVASGFSFFSGKAMPIFAALVLLFAGSAGVSIAAGKSLPGDLLYPVKVSINEKLGGAFATTEEAKAAYETALADTRLSEAEALAAKDNLTSATAVTLKTDFTVHADNARTYIADLEQKGSVSADTELSSLAGVLSTHEDLLSRGFSGDGGEKKKLIAAIRSEARGAEELTSPEDAASVSTAKAAAPATPRSASAIKPVAGQQSAKANIRALLQSIAATSTDDSATSTESVNYHTDLNGTAGNIENKTELSGSAEGSLPDQKDIKKPF